MAKEKMIRRVVVQGVTVVRDGQRKSPELNKAFDFTQQEIDYLDRVAPAATRKTVNETVAEDAVVVEEPEGGDTGTDETAPDANAKPTATKTPKRGKTTKKAPAKTEEPESDESDDEEAEDADESEDDDI